MDGMGAVSSAQEVTYVAVRQIVHHKQTSIGRRRTRLVGCTDVTEGLCHQGWDLGSGVAMRREKRQKVSQPILTLERDTGKR